MLLDVSCVLSKVRWWPWETSIPTCWRYARCTPLTWDCCLMQTGLPWLLGFRRFLTFKVRCLLVWPDWFELFVVCYAFYSGPILKPQGTSYVKLDSLGQRGNWRLLSKNLRPGLERRKFIVAKTRLPLAWFLGAICFGVNWLIVSV